MLNNTFLDNTKEYKIEKNESNYNYLYISCLLSHASLNERYFNYRITANYLNKIQDLKFDEIFNFISSNDTKKDLEVLNKIKLKYESNININKLLKIFKEQNISYLTYGQEKYPDTLRNLKEPPSVIYFKGNKNLKDLFQNKLNIGKNVAIVGTRSPTSHGHFKARELAYNLSKDYFIIVSGLAKGIDLDAHIGALTGGRTIAVLAGGVNIIYPKEHQEVYNDICVKGLIISEKLPDFKPNQFDFLFRNRIIAALSNFTIIIEASNKSGTKSQANYVKNLKKDIFVLKPFNENRITSEFIVQLMKENYNSFESYEDLKNVLKKKNLIN